MPRKTTDAQREEALRLYQDVEGEGAGMTLQAIADRVGISPETIIYHVKKAGLPKRPYGGRAQKPPTPIPTPADLFEMEMAKIQARADEFRAAGDEEKATAIEIDITKLRRLQEMALSEGFSLKARDTLNQQLNGDSK